MTVPAIELADFLVPAGSVGAGIWLFYRLFIRADRRERDAFREVKEQRDYQRARAEEAERKLANCTQELAGFYQRYGEP